MFVIYKNIKPGSFHPHSLGKVQSVLFQGCTASQLQSFGNVWQCAAKC